MKKRVKTFENYNQLNEKFSDRISVIFSPEYDFQVLHIVEGGYSKAWDIANELWEDGTFEANKIYHYDVMSFDNIQEMNNWILEQVEISRKDKK